MSTISKERVKDILEFGAGRIISPITDDEIMELARIALASLEAEPVAYADPQAFRNFQAGVARREWMWRNPGEDLIAVYTAPPAPVSVPDENDAIFRPVADVYGISVPGGRSTTYSTDSSEASDCRAMGWGVQEYVKLERYQAAMLQGAGVTEKCRSAENAQEVQEYPEALPCPVLLEPGLRFGNGVPTKTMLDALQRRAEYYAELEAMTPEQRAEHDAGMKEFAAMLQGGKS